MYDYGSESAGSVEVKLGSCFRIEYSYEVYLLRFFTREWVKPCMLDSVFLDSMFLIDERCVT